MLLSGLLPQDFSCRQHQFLLLSVYRDDPDLQRFSLIFFKVLHIRQRQMRSRNKSADTFQVGNHSRIHNLTYLDSDLFLLLQITGQYIPCKYRVRFFSWEQDVPLSVIHFHHRSLDHITLVHIRHHRKSRIIAHIRCFDDTLRIILEIQRDLFLIHSDHRTLDHIAFLNFAERCFQFFFIVFHCLFHNLCPPCILFDRVRLCRITRCLPARRFQYSTFYENKPIIYYFQLKFLVISWFSIAVLNLLRHKHRYPASNIIKLTHSQSPSITGMHL